MQRTREKSWGKTREVGRTPAPAGSHRHQRRAFSRVAGTSGSPMESRVFQPQTESGRKDLETR